VIRADSDRVDGTLLAEKELALLCALRNQTVLALMPERKTGEASSTLTGTTGKRPFR
jgi:hypothetical protein